VGVLLLYYFGECQCLDIQIFRCLWYEHAVAVFLVRGVGKAAQICVRREVR